MEHKRYFLLIVITKIGKALKHQENIAILEFFKKNLLKSNDTELRKWRGGDPLLVFSSRTFKGLSFYGFLTGLPLGNCRQLV